MRYQYVLWDFDGTLVDTSEGIYKSLRVAFAQMGLKLPSPEILQQFIGPPLNYSFQNFIGLPPEEALRATKCFRADYAQDGLFHSQVYPGMADILKELHAKGAGVGVATLKPEKMARLLLDRFGLMPLLGTCCGTSGDETASATKADIIRRALGELGCRDLSDAVLIGDTLYDLQGAQDVGIDFISAAYGFGTDPKMEQESVCVIQNAQQLRSFLFQEDL